jgi:DNA-binding CsgD family transcriptional regulator
VNDPLTPKRLLPNEASSRDYLMATYGPTAQKTFVAALEAFFAQEFPQLAGERARRAIVQGIVGMVDQFYPATSHLRQGQTTWVSIAKDELSSYGKTIAACRMVSTVITLVAPDEAQQRAKGRRLRDIKRDAVARICTEIDEQKGCVTASELAVMLKTTPTTIGTYIAQWEAENNRLLPRRGTIHDMGPTLTHKKEICRLLFLEGKTVTETMRITKHSERAIDRYITNFRQVFTCKTKGLNLQETASATKLSRRLVEEYHRLFDEYAVTNTKFDALLKQSVKI